MATINKPELFMLSLAMQTFLDSSYASMIDSLQQHANIKRAKTSVGALRYLAANEPKIVLITDEGLTEADNKPVLDAVLAYVRKGGLAIVGLHFPNFTNMDIFDSFWSEFGLPWKHGDYHRSTFQVNPSSTLPAGVNPQSLPGSYSMKVLHVQHARPHEMIYVPTPGATTQSHVFPPESVDQAQAAVVGAQVGNGYLVYVGDVNPGSDEVILALCGMGSY